MQIKSYNRAVDPNTIQGQEQAPNNVNAFGGNTAGQEQITKGLGAVQAQVQGYIDDQINMSVISASNKYQEGLNDLLNNPDTGLFTKQDMNALDVMKQFQEGEAKIRQETLGTLPNYQKAHDAFTRMADDAHLTKLGSIMQYQYKKTEEHRQDTLNTALSNTTDKIIEGKDMNGLYKGFQQNLGLIYSTYGKIYGKDKMDQMIKTANTNMALQVIQNSLATGDESSYENAYNILKNISPYIDDAAATRLKSELSTRKRDNEKLNLAAQAYQLYPNDAKKRREWLSSQNTVTTYSGGGTGAQANTDTPLMNSLGNAISAKIMQKTGKYLPAGWIAAQLSMESAKGTSLVGSHNYGGRKLEDGNWANYDSDDAFIDSQADYLSKYAEDGIFDANNLTEFVNALGHGGYYGDESPDSYLGKIRAHMNGMSEDKDNPETKKSQYTTYDLPTQGDSITEQVNHLKPEWKTALPIIGGILQQYGLANGATISSGARSKEHNAEVNGVEGSLHIDNGDGGNAVDIVLPDSTTDEQAQNIKKVFIDTGNFTEVLFHDAGSGYHLHLGGYNGGFSYETSGVTSKTTTKYSQAEIDNMASMSDQYEAQDKREQQIANDNLVKQGQLEMMQLHSQGISDPEQYQSIVEKYGANNPSVYATLRGSMGTFGAIAVRPVSISGGGGGSSGGGRSSSGSSRGTGGRDTVTNIKSLIGTDFHSYQDIVDYCNMNGISLSASEQISLNKAMEDYRNGTGEYKPEYTVSADDIANAGVDKSTFEHQMPVVQQLTRQWAIQFKETNGREPTYNELREAAVGFVTTDSGNTGSQVDYRSAGIDTTVDVGDGYTRIFWTDNTSSDYPTYIARKIIDGSLSRNDVENGNYD